MRHIVRCAQIPPRSDVLRNDWPYGTAMNPATTGAAVSYGLLTRAYESEPFRNAMLRMANIPRGSTAFEKAMQQAQKAINALTQGAKSDSLSE